MIFPRKSVGFIFTVVLITAIFVSITHFIVNIFAAKKNPAAVEDNIHMKLLLCPMFFYACSMNTHHISNASNLWTVFDSFAVENTVYKLVTFAGFITQSIV